MKTTPLHSAAMNSKWSVVECLVGWGAALNLVNSNEDTPLHLLIKSKDAQPPETSQLKQVHVVDDIGVCHILIT